MGCKACDVPGGGCVCVIPYFSPAYGGVNGGVFTASPINSMQIGKVTLVLLAAGCDALNIAERFFTWFTTSEAVARIHEKHVNGDKVMHMLKDTPFAAAPDDMKLDFARGPAGAAVADFMRLEQQYIGDWKLQRIVEAAGLDFDADQARADLILETERAPVVMFSFVDCPWCLLAKEALAEAIPDGDELRVVELEELGREGKKVRAAIALATQRTSMPSIFVGGRAIGGFTDGEPRGDDELCVSGSQGLQNLIESGEFETLRQSASLGSAGSPKS